MAGVQYTASEAIRNEAQRPTRPSKSANFKKVRFFTHNHHRMEGRARLSQPGAGGEAGESRAGLRPANYRGAKGLVRITEAQEGFPALPMLPGAPEPHERQASSDRGGSRPRAVKYPRASALISGAPCAVFLASPFQRRFTCSDGVVPATSSPLSSP